MTRRPAAIIALILLLIPTVASAGRIALLVSESDSHLVNRAVQELGALPGLEVDYAVPAELVENKDAADFVHKSDVLLVDVMIPELTEFLENNPPARAKKIYALRGSRNDDALKAQGYDFEPSLKAYFDHLAVGNIKNMIRRAAHLNLDSKIEYAEVAVRPELGLYHPDAPRVFTDYDRFFEWYQQRPGFQADRPWVGLMFFSSFSSPARWNRSTGSSGVWKKKDSTSARPLARTAR